MSRIYFYNTGPGSSQPFDATWTDTSQADKKIGQIEGALQGTVDTKGVVVNGKTLARQFYINNIRNGLHFAGHISGAVRAKSSVGGAIRPYVTVRLSDQSGHAHVIYYGAGLPLGTTLLGHVLPALNPIHPWTIPSNGQRYDLLIEYGFILAEGYAPISAVGTFEFGNPGIPPHQYDLPLYDGSSTPGSQWVEFDFPVSYND